MRDEAARGDDAATPAGRRRRRAGRRPVLLVAAALVAALLTAGCSASVVRAGESDPPDTTAPPTTVPTTTVPTTTEAVATAGDGPAPTLGEAFRRNARGYGEVRPSVMDAGGTATSLVTDVSWSSWGGDLATGTGSALYVPDGAATAEGVREQATITASDLGSCPDGHRAYRSVSWSFPAHPGATAPGFPDICASTEQTSGSPTSCSTSSLGFALGAADGAAGSTTQELVLTNTGFEPCLLHGYPRVQYVAGDDGHSVGEPARSSGTVGAGTVLTPGDSARAALRLVSTGPFDPSTCQATHVRGLRVYPPDDSVAAYLPRPGDACSGPIGQP